MRRITLMVLILLLVSVFFAYAEGIKLIEVRNEIFKTSQEIKQNLSYSKDPILLNSMWDSCIIAVTQLDAYFSMAGLFDNIKKEDLDKNSFRYLISWLDNIKKTNELNIKILDTAATTFDQKTKVYISRLRNNFIEINADVLEERTRISLLENSAKSK